MKTVVEHEMLNCTQKAWFCASKSAPVPLLHVWPLVQTQRCLTKYVCCNSWACSHRAQRVPAFRGHEAAWGLSAELEAHRGPSPVCINIQNSSCIGTQRHVHVSVCVWMRLAPDAPKHSKNWRAELLSCSHQTFRFRLKNK